MPGSSCGSPRCRPAPSPRRDGHPGGRVMRFPVQPPRSLFRRATAKDDAMSGLVLGVEGVPDGLANGLLAGVNPVAGLYAYLFGLAGGALFTSTTLMADRGDGGV